MSIVIALSDSFILAHTFSFLKSQTAGMLAVVFEVPWALVQKSFSALLADPHLAWVSSWKKLWKISSIDELRIFFHAQQCCHSMNRGDREPWEKTMVFNWAGEEVRVDIATEMASSTFLIRIPFQIAIYVSWGVGEDGKKVHHLLAKYVISQSANMTITEKMVMNWSSYFAACGL